jgi:hypothetical protein
LAEIIVGVLHRIIRRLAGPVVNEACGFNAAIVITRAASTSRVRYIFCEAVAIDSQ